MNRLTRKQAAIIGAYTANTLGPFGDIVDYVHTLKGFEGIADYGMVTFKNKIREACKEDFLSICADASDSLDEPVKEVVVQLVQTVPSIGNAPEELFRRAFDKVMPPSDKMDPKARTARKLLNSVWIAYEELKAGVQAEQVVNTPEQICENGLKAYVQNSDSLVAALKDEQHD